VSEISRDKSCDRFARCGGVWGSRDKLRRLNSARSRAATHEAPEQRALRNEISCGKSCAVKLKRKILRLVS